MFFRRLSIEHSGRCLSDSVIGPSFSAVGMHLALVVAYHVDRSRTLAAGATIDTAPAPVLPADVPDLESEWPGGLTAHGLRYACSMTFDGSTVPEWLFELVRRNEFAEAHSRFQSIFALESLFDARAFRHYGGGVLDVPIFRVHGQLAHRANMNLIRWNAPALGGLARAREYWRGEQGIAAPMWELLLAPPVRVLDLVDEAEAV